MSTNLEPQNAASIRALYPTPEDAPSRVMTCTGCHMQRWVGYGPCGTCGEPSPWSDDKERDTK